MIRPLRNAAMAAILLLPLISHAADSQRQTEVAKLGAEVMPFSLKATTHIFTKTAEGGTHIHGRDMPGLAELKAAKPGQITIDYKDVEGGAELGYRTTDAKLVGALHTWSWF